MMPSAPYKVVIIQKRLPQYRKPFFELLRKRLAPHGIELVLIYGTPTSEQQQRKDNVQIEWAHAVKNREINIGPTHLLWQPCLGYIRNADIVIVEQASKLLVNYVLFILHKLRVIKLCFWGHGKRFLHSKTTSLGERLKTTMSRGVHWWFAYNNRSAKIVTEMGFPPQRISSVQNAVDTRGLIARYETLTKEECDTFKQKYSIQSDHVCLFIGSLYAERRIDFLLDSCKAIREKLPDFEVLILGAGPEEHKIKYFEQNNHWLHLIGPVFGEAKVPFFKISKLVLLPGPVGLVVVESFAFETPVVTVDLSTHGPEIDYIVNGENGMIVNAANDPVLFADKVVELINEPPMLQRLKAGCKIARDKYTIDVMVDRFSEGIQKALGILH